MQLKRSELSRIEDVIFKTGIPHEDVKIELIDHLATVVEYKLDENPDLTFENALSMASINVKESILSIRMAIRKNTIQNLIMSVYKFSTLKDISLIVFFTSIAFMIFVSNGKDSDAILLSYLAIPVITIVFLWLRLRKIKPQLNYRLLILKRYAWLPILFMAGSGLLISVLSLILMNVFCYFSYFDNLLLFIISLSYGYLMKTVIDTLIFNIHDIKERIEVDEMFLPELV